MSGLNLFEEHAWRPLASMGLTHSFFNINSHTLISTWAALLAIFVLALIGRYFLAYPASIGGYLTRLIITSFMNLVEQSIGFFNDRYCSFIASLFIFIIGCNWIGLIPLLEEPTKDLNTTLALGLIAFFYIQTESIKKHGIKEYIKDYFSPIFLMFPLNILGELATIVSLSFRLFGNIFGGSVILGIFKTAIAGSWIGNILVTVTGVNIVILVFFILFEGFLQAFVFSILSLTNLTMAVHEEQAEHLI